MRHLRSLVVIITLAVMVLALPVMGAPANEKATVIWGTIDAKNTPKDVLAQIGTGEVLTDYEWAKGILLNRKHFRTLIMKVAPNQLPEFQKIGFAELTEMRLSMNWARVSDINGWGTEVNGEIHRRTGFNLDLKKDEILDGIKRMRDMLKNPAAELKRVSATRHAEIYTGRVNALERGFVVDFTVELSHLNAKGTFERMFQQYQRSGYYR